MIVALNARLEYAPGNDTFGSLQNAVIRDCARFGSRLPRIDNLSHDTLWISDGKESGSFCAWVKIKLLWAIRVSHRFRLILSGRFMCSCSWNCHGSSSLLFWIQKQKWGIHFQEGNWHGIMSVITYGFLLGSGSLALGHQCFRTGGLFCFSGINYTTESTWGNESVEIWRCRAGSISGMGTRYTELLHTLLA